MSCFCVVVLGNFFSHKVEQLPSQHVQQLLRAGLEGRIDVIDSKMSEGGDCCRVRVSTPRSNVSSKRRHGLFEILQEEEEEGGNRGRDSTLAKGERRSLWMTSSSFDTLDSSSFLYHEPFLLSLICGWVQVGRTQ